MAKIEEYIVKLIDGIKNSLSACEHILANKDFIIKSIESGQKFHLEHLNFSTYVGLCANANLYPLNKEHYAISSLGLTYDELPKYDCEGILLKYYEEDEFDSIPVGSWIADEFIKYNKAMNKWNGTNLSYPVKSLIDCNKLWLNPNRWEYVEHVIKKLKEILALLEK